MRAGLAGATAEHSYPIADIADARGVCVSTITRWVLYGCRGRDGLRHKLHASRFGGRWFITLSALDRFSEALSRDPAEAIAV
jgi:hypothetical protein